MIEFFAGLITMGYLAAGLFFLRFWKRTHDMLFLIFGTAFGLLALTQTLVTLSGLAREEQSWIYLLRLAAFSLIIVAILAKNMQARSGSRDRLRPTS